ncbi:MAG: arylesterase [Zoogloea sp.]|uniref:arylesterase n=1 Tax=Zoogloea sp. TaxID=49181 RepID=UPI003F377672
MSPLRPSLLARLRPLMAGLVLGAGLLALPAQAGTVLVWGDSLSAGFGLARGQGWVWLLEQKLASTKPTQNVVNGSVSGETTAGGLTRLPAALATHKPDVVILELGANDGLRGLSPQTMEKNLESMVDASQKAGARVLLVGMRMPPNYGPDYTRRYEEAFAGLARRRKLAFVPFLMEGFADKPELFQQDGIHPAPQAQGIMLDTVLKSLKPLLR